MVTLRELVSYTNDKLDIGAFRDYCPNGLQVEGRPEIRTLVSGVSASQALLEAAIEAGADALLVHHGWFWKGEDERVVGIKRHRLKTLLEADVSLIAYHLPLDAHPELGNNAQLARRLGFLVEGSLGEEGGPGLVQYGRLPDPATPGQMSRHLHEVLGREPLHIPGGGRMIGTVAWCSGAAQSQLPLVAEHGLDAFITGEVSEQTVHIARESGVHFYSAGHHATERYGVQALGEHLAGEFALKHRFIDIENPV